MILNNDPIHKRIAEFLELNVPDCTFVGISSDKEVFISFEEDNEALQTIIKKTVKAHFGNEISFFTSVPTSTLSKVMENEKRLNVLVAGLNKTLDETKEPDSELLQIGNF